MQNHSESYDAFKMLRKVDARVTIVPKEAEFLSKVSITCPEPEYWEIFSPDGLIDGNTSETAAATVSYSYGRISITLPEKRKPYLKICFADGWQMAEGDIVSVLVRTSGADYALDIIPKQKEIVINEEYLRNAYAEGVYPVGTTTYGYLLHFLASTRISEISVIPDSELKKPVVFNSDEIISMSIQEELDPLCKSFPMRKLSLSLDNSGKVFNTFAADNFDGCSTKTEIAIDGEYINTGEFFIDSFVTQNNGLTVKITAYDCVKAMEKYKTGYTLAPGNTATLSELIAMGNLAFAGVTFNVDITGFTRVAPHMTSSDTQRNVLKGIAQAAGGRIWADRNNVVNIMRGCSPGTHMLDADRIYSYDGITDVRPPQLFILEGESNTGKYSAHIGSYAFGCDVESITNNFIASGNESYIAQTLYDRMQGRSEMTVKYRGDPCIEINDFVFLIGINGEGMAYFEVIGVTLDYNGGLSGTLKLKGWGQEAANVSDISKMALYSMPRYSGAAVDFSMTRSGLNPAFIKEDESGDIQFAPNPLYYLDGVPVNDEESYLKAGYKKTDAGEGTHAVIDGGVFAVNQDGSLVKIQSTQGE